MRFHEAFPRRSPTFLVLALALVGCSGGSVKIVDSQVPVLDDSDSEPVIVDTDPDPVDTGCADSGTLQTWYRDADDDGYGDPDDDATACDAPTGYIATGGDCDDTDPAVSPGSVETCNNLDDNCDMIVDEGFDADADGHDATSCPSGDDCDDADATVYPGAEDECGDGLDTDCDGADAFCGYDTDLGVADAILYAIGRGDDLGRHMDAGDLNGDGADDVVVGAMWSNSYTGAAWVANGPVSGSQPIDDVAYQFKGGTSAYESGRTIGVIDVDGDAYADVFVGSPDSSGWDAVIQMGPFTGDLNFNSADVQTKCLEAIECGHGGDLADIDGDGIGDALIAAGEQNTGGYMSGSVYLMYGPLSATSGELPDLADYELIGETASSETGRIVSAGGDVDGDGVNDALITASYDSEGGPYAGAVHVVCGPVTTDLDLEDSDGKLLGAAAYDYAGEALAMGDLDGDGKAEAIVGAYQAARASGVVYGVVDASDGTVSLSSSDIIITGSAAEGMGASLASRDVDGDDISDLLSGAYANSDAGSGAGSAYLFFGPMTGAMGGTDAYAEFTGEDARDAAGTGVGLGDLDGNGLADILIGATGDSTGASNAGALFVVYSGE